MKNDLLDQFLKEGVVYQGIIIRMADGHSLHLNFNRVPMADFRTHMVQVLNAMNQEAKQGQGVEIVEAITGDKAALKKRIKELNERAGLPGVCKAGCKQGAVH